jgi:acyl carrier protein
METGSKKTIKQIIKKIIGNNKGIYPDSKKIMSDLIRDSLDIFFP